MRTLVLSLTVVLAAASAGYAQQAPPERLPADVLDVLPPSARVDGAPGRMTIQRTSCPSGPTAQVRRRIVDLAIQEWGYFGFSVVDQTRDDGTGSRTRRSLRRLGGPESARVAASIAGYWTVAPGGDWILESQNKIWKGSAGATSRWRYPWSAAFVSWVMCEGGLAESARFQRAIAHHVYIDQAIRARDAESSRAAFAAYDVGEAVVAPGDLLCTARRPSYATLAERRRQMGEGARTHCDVVVKVDEASERILAIDGNVRGSVSLKILPAIRKQGRLRPAGRSEARGGRTAFAHLSLRAESVDANAFDTSLTSRALGCAGGFDVPARRAAAGLVATTNLRCAD